MEQTTSPVIPPTAPVINPTTTTGGKEYATFLSRALAAIIDGILIGVVTSGLSGFTDNNNSIGTLIGAAYHIYMLVNYNGATLGKQAMGIKVVTASGQPIDYKTAALRYIGYIISGLALGLGFIWVLFDEKKQGWHDKIANTYVVKK